MNFAAFAERADEIEAEDADLAVVASVAELFADAGDDLPVIARFVQGRIFPAHDSRKLAIGSALLYETIARAASGDVTSEDVESKLADMGEIGAVAASYEFGAQTGLAAFGAGGGAEDLTVAEVYDSFADIAAAEGDGSDDTRRDTLFGLFNRASPVEAKYLARLVMGSMRIGVGEGSVRDAVAEAFLDADVSSGVDGSASEESSSEDDADGAMSLTNFAEGDSADSDDEGDSTDDSDENDSVDGGDDSLPDARALDLVERALQVTNDYGRVATLAREEGPDGLDAVGLEIGRPVQAMLAQAGTVTDALEAWDAAAVETKYDGARVQIHADGDDVSIYSRNMEDVTGALPELVEHVREHLAAPAIIDGEAVAVDDDGETLPFQEILRRFRRKHDVDRMREEVAVELRAFDCLHVGEPYESSADTAENGPEDLLDAPLVERHEKLSSVLSEGVAELTVSDDAAEIEEIEAAALEAGHEGIMLKDPDSTYSPGKRGKNWLKRKPDVETLDLAVVGAEWGEGRRANLFGTFHIAARVGEGGSGSSGGADGEEAFEPVGKVATGITDEELARLTALLEPHVVSEEGTAVTFSPEIVFEVGYEEIQQSPSYESGFALRFPRYLGVREDLGVEDADSVERVARLAEEQ
jgi:DNA ligase-1